MVKNFLKSIIEDWKKSPLAKAAWLVVFFLGYKLYGVDSFLNFSFVVVVAMIVEACVERFENNVNRMLGIWDGIADEVNEQYAIVMEQAETPSRLREMKLGKTI
jgi:hypothetical protein